MGKIHCIIGKSASGKDTLFLHILSKYKGDIIPVVPYTTRPKRIHEVDGVDYHFVSEEQMVVYEKNDQIVEKRSYQTVHGIWHYFTLNFYMDKDRDYLLITTLEGACSLQHYYGSEHVNVVYLFLDDKERLLRGIIRESKQINPNYSEVCRRFLADQNDFSDEKLSLIRNLYPINTGDGMENTFEQWEVYFANERKKRI